MSNKQPPRSSVTDVDVSEAPPPFSFVSLTDFSLENALVNLLVSDANISVTNMDRKR